MSSRLPRAYRLQLKRLDAEKVRRIVEETTDDDTPRSSVGATAPGDARRLRGLPAIGRGVGGAISGSDPLKALLASEGRRRQEQRSG